MTTASVRGLSPDAPSSAPGAAPSTGVRPPAATSTGSGPGPERARVGLDRLESWVHTAENDRTPIGPVVVPLDPAEPAPDCVRRAWDAYHALHGRRGNLRRAFDDTAVTGTGQLLAALGGTASTVTDPDAVWTAVTGTPGAMALVITRPDNGRGHAYWLLADDRTGQVVPRWIDTQRAGAFDTPARWTGEPDGWAAGLRARDTRVLLIGPDGRPMSAAPTPVSRTVGALLDRAPGLTEAGVHPTDDRTGTPSPSPSPVTVTATAQNRTAHPEPVLPERPPAQVPGRGNRLLGAFAMAATDALRDLGGWPAGVERALRDITEARATGGRVRTADVTTVVEGFQRRLFEWLDRQSDVFWHDLRDEVPGEDLAALGRRPDVRGLDDWIRSTLLGTFESEDPNGALPAVIGRFVGRPVWVTTDHGGGQVFGGGFGQQIRLRRRTVTDPATSVRYHVYDAELPTRTPQPRRTPPHHATPPQPTHQAPHQGPPPSGQRPSGHGAPSGQRPSGHSASSGHQPPPRPPRATPPPFLPPPAPAPIPPAAPPAGTAAADIGAFALLEPFRRYRQSLTDAQRTEIHQAATIVAARIRQHLATQADASPFVVEVSGGGNGSRGLPGPAEVMGGRRAWRVRQMLEAEVRTRLRGLPVQVRFVETSRGRTVAADVTNPRLATAAQLEQHRRSVVVRVRTEGTPTPTVVAAAPRQAPAPVVPTAATVQEWQRTAMDPADRIALRGRGAWDPVNAVIMADPVALMRLGGWGPAAQRQLQLAREARTAGPSADPADRLDALRLTDVRGELLHRMADAVGQLPDDVVETIRQRFGLADDATTRQALRAALTGPSLPAEISAQVLAVAGFLLHRPVIVGTEDSGRVVIWSDADGPPLRLIHRAHEAGANRFHEFSAWAPPGQDPPDPATANLAPIALPRVAFSAGAPRGTLPHLAQLVEEIATVAAAHGVPDDRVDRTALAQMLMTHARHLVGSGVPVTVGTVEFLVSLDPSDPQKVVDPAGSFRTHRPPEHPAEPTTQTPAPAPVTAPQDPTTAAEPNAAGRARKRGITKTIEVIQGLFDVSAQTSSRSGPTTNLRARLNMSFGFGIPKVLEAVRIAVTGRTVMNASSRGTGTVRDAETGHVEDTRDAATLVSAKAEWGLRYRTNIATTWTNAPTVAVATPPDSPERLLTWIPDHYLDPPEDTVADDITVPARPAAATRREAARHRTAIPETFFSSGLTNLAELSDAMLAQMRALRLDVSIGSPLRTQATQLLWNLDTHLDRAVNELGGYEFALRHEGRTVAQVAVHSRRRGADRVGRTSKKAHLELVRTAIAGHSTSHTVSQEGSLEVGLDFQFGPGVGVRAPYVRVGWFDRDNVGAGRTGLWVTANRYAGPTTGYDAEFESTVTVTARPPRNVLRRHRRPAGTPEQGRLAGAARRIARPPDRSTSAPVVGRTLLRLPTADAALHGYETPGPAPQNQSTSATRPVPAHVAQPELPEYVRAGAGIGQGLAIVDRTIVEDLRNAVVPELQRHGFLPHRMDAPFHRTAFWRWSAKADSQIANRALLHKMVSAPSLDSNYNQNHQDGTSFTLRLRNSGLFSWWYVDTARVTITAVPTPDPARNPPAVVGPTPGRRTDEWQIVNLAMGLGSASHSASGGRRLAWGARLRGAPKSHPHLKNVGIGVEGDVSIEASNSISSVTNMPKLLEYPGELAEFRLPSRYRVTVEYGKRSRLSIRRWLGQVRQGFTSGPIAGDATVRLVPHFDVPAPTNAPTNTPTPAVAPPGQPAQPPAQPNPARPTSAAPTPPDVLRQAAVLHLDTTGATEALRALLPKFANPGDAGDDEITTFAGNTSLLAHVPEILAGRYTSDSMFKSRLRRDRFGAMSVSGALGRSTFVGATEDKYVLGLIQLGLAQSGQSHSTGKGVGVSADIAEGGDPPAAGVLDVSGSQNAGFRVGSSTRQSHKTTGGRELLELNFQRAYAFRTTVDLTVRGTVELNAKLWARRITRGSRRVDNRSMVYVLSEPDALAHYAAGRLPLSDDQLSDVMRRYTGGSLHLDNTTVARILTRWSANAAQPAAQPAAPVFGPQPPTLHQHAARFAERYRVDGLPVPAPDRAAFDAAFQAVGLTLPADNQRTALERDVWIPPYFTGDGPKSLGHAGVKELTLDGRTAYDLVRDAIDRFEPGLLGREGDDWTDGEDWNLRPRTGPDPHAVVGRVQGAIDALQATFAGDRAQPMVEQMLHANGMTMHLVNPSWWVLSEVVDINVRMEIVSDLEVGDFVPDSGNENYGHQYVETSATTTKSHSRSAGAGLRIQENGNSPREVNPAQSGGLRVAEGRNRSTTQTEQMTAEQTVYDWAGYYPATARVRMHVTVTRRSTKGRPLRNTLAWLRQAWSSRDGVPMRQHLTDRADGTITLRLPKGLTEARPPIGPQPRTDLTRIPALPGDAYVSAAVLDDGLAAFDEVMTAAVGSRPAEPQRRIPWHRRLFGRSPIRRDSALGATLFSRFHQAAAINASLTPDGFLLATNVFQPGRPSKRADIRMNGELYGLEVVAPITGAGTGRYAKYNKGVTSNLTHETPNPALSGSVTAPGRLNDPDPANPEAARSTHRGDGATDGAREASESLGDNTAEAYRREQHGKSLGDSVLVRVTGRFELTATPRRFGWGIRRPTTKADVRSRPFTGDVYVQMFAGELAELRRQMAERHTRETLGPLPVLPATDATTPAIAFYDELDAVPVTQDSTADGVARELARRLRARIGDARVATVDVDAAVHDAAVERAVRAWARGLLGVAGLQAAVGRYPANGTGRHGAPITLADHLITEVNTWHGNRQPVDPRTGLPRPVGPLALPSAVRRLALNPTEVAARVARELGVHLYVTLPQPPTAAAAQAPSAYLIEPTGRHVPLERDLTHHHLHAHLTHLDPRTRDEAVTHRLTQDELLDIAANRRGLLRGAVAGVIRNRNRHLDAGSPTPSARPAPPRPTRAQLDELTRDGLIAADVPPDADSWHRLGDDSWFAAYAVAEAPAGTPPRGPRQVRAELAAILRDPSRAVVFAARITANRHSDEYADFLAAVDDETPPTGEMLDRLIRIAPEMLGRRVRTLDDAGVWHRRGPGGDPPVRLIQVGGRHYRPLRPARVTVPANRPLHQAFPTPQRTGTGPHGTGRPSAPRVRFADPLGAAPESAGAAQRRTAELIVARAAGPQASVARRAAMTDAVLAVLQAGGDEAAAGRAARRVLHAAAAEARQSTHHRDPSKENT